MSAEQQTATMNAEQAPPSTTTSGCFVTLRLAPEKLAAFPHNPAEKAAPASPRTIAEAAGQIMAAYDVDWEEMARRPYRPFRN